MRIGGMHYEFTKDAHLLQQYYALLQKCYSTDLKIHLTEIRGTVLEQKEREYNERGHIIVARVGQYVIGGARLVIAPPGGHLPLPMEASGVRLTNMFPDAMLDDTSYAEIGRLALLLDFRGGEVVKNIVRHCLGLVQLHHCSRGFWMAPLKQALYYKRVLSHLQMHSTLHRQVDMPYTDLYRHQQFVIGSCDLSFPDFTSVLLDEAQAVPA